MSYRELVDGSAKESEIRSFLADGSKNPTTIRITENLKNAASEVAEGQGMSFSALIRKCLIEELLKGATSNG